VFKDETLKYSCGTIGNSNRHAAFQFLVNLLDYNIPANQAVALPRFGSNPYDTKTWKIEYSKNWLDKRFSKEIVDTLKARGLYFSQKKPRLGKGCIAEFHPDGKHITGYHKLK
jgi:gamma-glutamyltranspeptidase